MNRYAIEVRTLKILRPLGVAFFVLITGFPYVAQTLPICVYMFLFAERLMTEGLTRGGVKG
jgi:hypothetical protein